MASIYANLSEQKKTFAREKSSTPTGTGLWHQHGRRFILLEHQYGHRNVMWKRSIITLVALSWAVFTSHVQRGDGRECVCVCWLRGAQEARKPLLNRVWIRCFVANVASPFQLTIIWEPVNNFTVRFVIVEANHRFILHLRCMVIANLWRFQSCLSLYRLQLASCAMQSRGMAWYHRARCGVIW